MLFDNLIQNSQRENVMKNRGKFIVLDGIDGSGKGTQAKLLDNYLFDLNKKNHVLLTREPYNSEFHDEIRKLLKEGASPKDNAELLTELFVKDRVVHAKLISNLLDEGIHIVCDRYKYVTLAYQQVQGVSLDRLLKLHEGVLIPDLAMIIDMPVDTALERISQDTSRNHLEVFERKDFQEKSLQKFLALPAILPNEKIVIINGNKPIAEVFDSVKQEVNKIL